MYPCDGKSATIPKAFSVIRVFAQDTSFLFFYNKKNSGFFDEEKVQKNSIDLKSFVTL